METFVFDKAADDHATHKLLNRSGIQPRIEIRSLWKEEPLRLLPGHDGNSNIIHDTRVEPNDTGGKPRESRTGFPIAEDPRDATRRYRLLLLLKRGRDWWSVKKSFQGSFFRTASRPCTLRMLKWSEWILGDSSPQSKGTATGAWGRARVEYGAATKPPINPAASIQ